MRAFPFFQSISGWHANCARHFDRWLESWRAAREEEANRRARRDEEAWKVFEHTRKSAEFRGMLIGEVVAIRQRARTGTKARVRWIRTGGVDAVWSPGSRLSRGQLLVVSGSHGHGPHHDERVFYINSSEVLPWGTYAGWLQHNARQSTQKTHYRN